MRASSSKFLLSAFLFLNGIAPAQILRGPSFTADAGFKALAGFTGSLPGPTVVDRQPPGAVLVPTLTLPRMSPELALQSYQRRAAEQSALLPSYSAHTLIQAELPDSAQHGEFRLERSFTAPRKLEFKPIQFSGDSFIKNNVIARFLRSEVDHLQKDDPALTAITSANYKFSYKGTPMVNGRWLHVFQVKPRAKRVGLFKGRIYLDAYTGSLLYSEGTLIKSPSMFIRQVNFEQKYADFGRFTLPVHIHSEALTRIVGRCVIDIDHDDYSFTSTNIESAQSDSQRGNN
ncbi:MAG TPA: hypothetical protein VFA89_17930 [Terriglobales bacterium]|nr:hypothetical protein [Terriglobales bacterium]